MNRKMQQSGKSIRFDLRPWLAFFATGLFLIAIFSYFGIFPFGPTDMLGTEIGGQYTPFLVTLKNQLLQGRSLTYSFHIGMGKNLAGVFAYYLSSPLNLIALLFPLSHLSEAVVLLVIVKLSLAGAFMTWLLDRKFQHETKMSILFGMLYALCSFSMVFMQQIMWMDGFALLPLVILMTERIRKAPQDWWKLLVVLVLLLASGYYMAYIVGMFALIYLMALLDYEGYFAPGKKPSGETVTGLFLLAALIAVLICGVVLLPAGWDLIKNGDNSQPLVPTVKPAFAIGAFLANLFPGRISVSQEYPSVYSDLLVLVLVILFYRNKSIPRRLKTWTAVILALGLLCFLLAPLNMFWHLFEEPARFMYRNAFLFVFGTILIAFYSYLHRKALATKDFLWTGAVVGAFYVISESAVGGKSTFFYPTLVFLAAILFFLWATTKEEIFGGLTSLPRASGVMLVLVLVVEIVFLNPVSYFVRLKKDAMDHKDYTLQVEEYLALTKKIPDSAFALVENDGETGLSSPILLAYADQYGMSSSLSMANKKQNRFLKQLGYRLNKNYSEVTHDSCILPSDSILGIRYIVSNKSELDGLSKIASQGQQQLFENTYAAGPAILADIGAADFDFYSLEKEEENKDYFAFQEQWFTSLSGTDASDLYIPCEVTWELKNGEEAPCDYKDLKIEPVSNKDQLNLENEETTSKALLAYIRMNTASPMRITAEVTVKEEGMLYLSVPFLMQSYPFEVYCNGVRVFSEVSSSDYSTIVNLGSFPVGETVQVEIRTDEDLFPCFAPRLAYVNNQILQEQMQLLRNGISNVEMEDGRVSFTAEAEKEKLVVTSIPYEKNWRVTVDGVPCKVYSYQDAFLCFPMEAGQHQVKMEFALTGGAIGVIISAVGLLSGTAVAILLKRRYSSSESDKK